MKFWTEGLFVQNRHVDSDTFEPTASCPSKCMHHQATVYNSQNSLSLATNPIPWIVKINPILCTFVDAP